MFLSIALDGWDGFLISFEIHEAFSVALRWFWLLEEDDVHHFWPRMEYEGIISSSKLIKIQTRSGASQKSFIAHFLLKFFLCNRVGWISIFSSTSTRRSEISLKHIDIDKCNIGFLTSDSSFCSSGTKSIWRRSTYRRSQSVPHIFRGC